jgi:hypothetical protein
MLRPFHYIALHKPSAAVAKPHNVRMRTFLAISFLAFATAALGQQDVEAARRSIAAVEQTLKLRPTDPTLWFYMSRFQAAAGDKKAATAALEKVAEYGEGFMPARDLGFENVWDDPGFQAVVAKLDAKLPHLDYAPPVFEIADRELLPEGIAYDSRSLNYFVGSVAKKKILRVTLGGVPSEFAGAAANLDSVLGLAVDAPRRKLYAVSTSALTDAGEKQRRNAVVSFDVDTGKLLRRDEIPEATQLNDVTVALGGRVYASDSGSGAIFELRPEAPARMLVPAGQIRGSNGLAASPDGKRLYVAHSTGIAVVDLASGAVKRVENPTRENIAAIDGLYEYQGELIGVQNVTNPGRVIRITLSKDGSAVRDVKTLLSHHHPSLDEPTTGGVSPEGYFFLLAATGVSRYNRQGKIDRPDSLPRPVVLRVLLPR